jgi:hypothetical protein
MRHRFFWFINLDLSMPSTSALAPAPPSKNPNQANFLARDWEITIASDGLAVLFDVFVGLPESIRPNVSLVGVSGANRGGVKIVGQKIAYAAPKGLIADDFFTYTLQHTDVGAFTGHIRVRIRTVSEVQVEIGSASSVDLQSHVAKAGKVTLGPGIYTRQTAAITQPTSLSGLLDLKNRPILRFFGSKESKGGLLVKGTKATLERLELWEASSTSSGNGAGLRFESNRDIPCEIDCIDVAFRYCENGVLGPDNKIRGGRISFLRCEFDRNGRLRSGQEHGAYIGFVDLLQIDSCYFHDTYTGHELKSRARRSEIRNSRFGSERSRASYETEFPSGGDVEISGCTFVQGKMTDNNFVLGFGAEWTPETGHPLNRIVVRDCIFWNNHPDGYVIRVDPKVPTPIVEFHRCTFIGFTQTWNPTFAVSAVVSTGPGNRTLSLVDALAEFGSEFESLMGNGATSADVESVKTGAITPRVWYQVRGTEIAASVNLDALADIPHLNKQIQAQNIITAWGGATHKGGKVVCFGTGHGDGAINARAEFDSESLIWKWVSPQSAKAIVELASPYASDTPKDTSALWHTRPLTDEESNKIKVSVARENRVLTGRYPDGLPAPVHGWSNAFRLRNGNFGHFNRTMDIAIYQQPSSKWLFQRFPNVYTDTYSMLVQVDEVTNSVWARATQTTVFEFPDIENSTRYKAHQLPEIPTHACLVGREIWYFCRPHGDLLVKLDLDNGSVSSVLLEYPASHVGMHFLDGSGCVYSPTFGVLRMDMLGRLWSVDPQTLACSPFYVLSGQPDPTNGIWSRIWTHRGNIYALPDGKQGVWVIRV